MIVEILKHFRDQSLIRYEAERDFVTLFLVIVDCQIKDAVSGEDPNTPNNENNENQYFTVLQTFICVINVFNIKYPQQMTIN